jgi:hypothetical protein
VPSRNQRFTDTVSSTILNTKLSFFSFFPLPSSVYLIKFSLVLLVLSISISGKKCGEKEEGEREVECVML